MTAEQNLKACNLRIICVLLLQEAYKDACSCIYRVYTSDGLFLDYKGFDNVPEYVRMWLKIRNNWEYTIPGCMFISGCKVL